MLSDEFEYSAELERRRNEIRAHLALRIFDPALVFKAAAEPDAVKRFNPAEPRGPHGEWVHVGAGLGESEVDALTPQQRKRYNRLRDANIPHSSAMAKVTNPPHGTNKRTWRDSPRAADQVNSDEVRSLQPAGREAYFRARDEGKGHKRALGIGISTLGEVAPERTAGRDEYARQQAEIAALTPAERKRYQQALRAGVGRYSTLMSVAREGGAARNSTPKGE
jgi:hypothetical protein